MTGTIYTQEYCYELALKCASRNEYRTKYPYPYKLSLQNKWINQYKWFKTPLHKGKTKYTKKECFKLAKKCISCGDMRKRYAHAYKIAKHQGYLSEYTWWLSTHEALSLSKQKLSDDEVIKCSKQFTLLRDFRTKLNNVYQMALVRGLLPCMTWLHRNDEASERKFTDLVYAYEFSDYNVVYVGRTINPIKRHREHCALNDSVAKFAALHDILVPQPVILADGLSPNDGGVAECKFMELYKIAGWTLLNKCKGGSLGALMCDKLSKSYCMRVAKRFTRLSDFEQQEQSVCAKMRRMKWLDECTWLIKENNNGYWSKMTLDEMRTLSATCSMRKEFQQKYPVAYLWACRRKWISILFPDNHNFQKVAHYDKDGNLIKIYSSMLDATADTGIKRLAINRSCHGMTASCKDGTSFKYV